jgi:hypothetical protein
MRDSIRDPLAGNSKLPEVKRMADRLYRMHENGVGSSQALAELSAFVGKPLTKRDLCGAFGTTDSETWAKDLVLDSPQIPTDLSYQEMLELIERVCRADGDEFQVCYWVECLKVNTGDEKISGLIYWPGEYFGDGNDSRELSPKAILDTALSHGKNVQ